ncbi:hypothetical protein P3L51_32950, partial [Streptomyces sp. PSRA5]|uniref:hypothetical protein n=1 Tax=Streptomyces panacea TaxID=3035064 RepID=UPI00339D1186
MTAWRVVRTRPVRRPRSEVHTTHQVVQGGTPGHESWAPLAGSRGHVVTRPFGVTRPPGTPARVQVSARRPGC